MNSKSLLSKHSLKHLALFLLFILLFLISNIVHASHFMGGEITWTCDNVNGKYHFTLRLYRECYGVEYKNTEIIHVINYPGLSKIPMTLLSKTDNSPVCNILGPHISCASPGSANSGAIEEWVYTSDIGTFTSGVPLSGVPPADGWIFAYKGGNRNTSDNINNADQQTWALRAIMFPYKGKNANPCYDNSPVFAEKPSTVICTGYHFTYNPNAYDNELDSLVYNWAQPLDSNRNPIFYNPTFSYFNPLPGTSLNPLNIPDTINPQTGEISFLSFTTGAYLTVSKVTAYKNKIKVAEIYREMQIVLLNCNANNPPGLIPPFKGNTSFIDTVYAGQVVDFHLKATDDIGQLITLNASGPDFGTNYMSSTTGCLTPPCATLIPPPTLSGSSPVETQFHWQTSCDHLVHPISVGSTSHLIYNQPTLSNVHNFVISIQDDFCAVPGKNVATISIVVLNKPILPAPSLRCVSVAVNGDINLSWVPPVDTSNSFYRYYIYYSLNSSGPFKLLDSIMNPTISSYTHVGANANNQVVYYYLKSLSGCNHLYESAPGDTLSSVLLDVNNTNNGTANLVWNALHIPPLPTSAGGYNVYKEYPVGSWNLINTTGNTIYDDTVTVCSAFINYRIEMPDLSGCISVSTVSGDLFKDNIAPFTPLIDSVSIDNSLKQSVIGWTRPVEKDAIGYIIYQFKNNVWTPIDTIKDINITKYINQNSFPYDASESYKIAAYDSCKNFSPLSPAQNTLHLAAALNICDGTITLSWNPYINMKDLEGYRVYVNENNAPSYTLLSTLNSTTTTFVHNDLLPGTNYCYFVQAFDNSGLKTSSSDIRCILSIVSKKSKFAYIRYATVVQEKTGDEHVDIRFIADSSSYISKYVLLRADSANGFYSPVTSITANGLFDVTFSDLSTFPAKQSYSYKVEVYDSCGNIAVTSNVGRSIFLVGSPNNDLSNTINWQLPYFDWDGTISGYNLYRDIGNTNNFSFLSNLPPQAPYTYTDDISTMTVGKGYYSYIVEALESPGINFPFSDISRSNKAVVLQQPKYFIPNAFNPESGSPKFTPIGIFNNESEYYFAIFSRWGVKVFETTEPNNGWDGTFNGSPAPFGTYAYILRYKDAVGKRLMKKGSVTLLR